MDASKLFDLGLRPRISLEAGIRMTYDAYLEEIT